MKIKQAFTLVELIVVITILAILGTIGFINLQGFSSSSRDSKRISELTEIRSGLQIYQARNGILPTPSEQTVAIGSSGVNIITQGYAGVSVLNEIRMNGNPKDPLDGDKYYTYSVNSNKTKFQLLALLENTDNSVSLSKINLIQTVNASYTDRYPYVVGNIVGIFLDETTNTPIQELTTSVDLNTDTNNYKVLFSDEAITSSGTVLYNEIVTKTENGNQGIVCSANYTLQNNSCIADSRICVGENGGGNQTWEGNDWGECNLEYCYSGFALNNGICEFTGTLSIQASDTNIAQNEPLLLASVKDIGGGVNKFFQVGNKEYYLSGLIPIDTTKQYRLSGAFRSAGTAQSNFYFGLVPYDENKVTIKAYEVYRAGNEAIIQSFNSSVINTDRELTGWLGGTTYVYQRTLAFYFDGDTTKLPTETTYPYHVTSENVYSQLSTDGTFSSTSGNSINLNQELPLAIRDKIIPGVTKVMNHTSGGSWMYTHSGAVPNTWTNYVSNDLTGEAFGNVGGITFRPQTKFVRILILANYHQDDTRELQFDNLLFQKLN